MPQPAIAQSKVCKSCHEEKSTTHYHTEKKAKDGLRSKCKDCRNLEFKQYRASLSSEEKKLRSIGYNYNLSQEKYQEMVQATPHCPICGSEEPLVVDHDHSTQEVRGLICNHCNLVLGHARDNIETLKNAIAYLEQ